MSPRRTSATCCVTASRRPCSVSSMLDPAVSAIRRTVAGRPITAAALSTLRVSSGRATTRETRSSDSVSGSGPPGPWRTRCSANRGFPAERVMVDRRRAGSGSDPSRPATSRAVSAVPRRSSGSRSVISSRASSASHPASGVPTTTASARYVTTRTARSLLRSLARKRTRSRVDRSAHCTSSTTSTTGATAPSRSSSPSTAWKRPSCEDNPSSEVFWGAAGTSPGTSRPSSGDRSSCRLSVPPRLSPRNAWLSGANGIGSPATGTHAP